MALTDQRRLFVEKYLQTFNASEAARQAGYSEKNVWAAASRLKDDPEIQAAIQKRLAEEAMTSDEVLHHLGELGRGQHADYFNVDKSGTIVSFDFKRAETDKKLNLIQKFKPVRGGQGYELHFHDRLKALELIGKTHKIFTDQVEQSGEIKVTVEYVDTVLEGGNDGT